MPDDRQLVLGALAYALRRAASAAGVSFEDVPLEPDMETETIWLGGGRRVWLGGRGTAGDGLLLYGMRDVPAEMSLPLCCVGDDGRLILQDSHLRRAVAYFVVHVVQSRLEKWKREDVDG